MHVCVTLLVFRNLERGLRHKRFNEIFHFCGDIRSQCSKNGCPRSQRLRGHPIFSLDKEIFIFLNYCHYCHLNNFFLADCFFKICEKPLKISKSVCVVIDYADTQFSKISNYIFKTVFDSILLFPKYNNFMCVSVVIDYADTCFSQISSWKRRSSQNCFRQGSYRARPIF